MLYPALQEMIDLKGSHDRLLSRSHDALQKSLEVLAQPRPTIFLGRRNLIEPPPIEYD